MSVFPVLLGITFICVKLFWQQKDHVIISLIEPHKFKNDKTHEVTWRVENEHHNA